MSWIAVDADLAEKPKVRQMGRVLGLDRDAVAGKLARVWGWFDRVSVDGFVDAAVDADVDDLARHDGFADAMRSVGWLVTDQPTGRIGIPAFDAHHGNSAKKRLMKTERQRRWRANKADSNVDASVDACVDQAVDACVDAHASTTEQNITIKKEQAKKEQAHSPKNGSRIPQDFPDDGLLDWAAHERPEVDARNEAAKFRDHWVAKPGKDGRKLDWPATWRNWIRNSRGTQNANRSTSRKLSVVEQIERNIADRKQREANELEAIPIVA